MTEVVHADIFFFITSVVVIVVGAGLAVATYFVIDILRDVRVVAKKVRKASDELEQDFEDLRSNIKSEGVRVRTVFEMVLGFMARQIPKAKIKRKAKEVTEDEA